MADTNFEQRFYAAVCDFLNKEGVEAAQVTYVEQDTRSAGYGCETCDFDETVVEISYIEKGTGMSRIYTYDGDMGYLMRALS